jgi:ribosome-binding protein aMBF1 (putative translation factor)
MNYGTDRNRKRWEALTPEQRAAVEHIRAEHARPEFREQEERDRASARIDFPPRTADVDLTAALASLRAERERQGLSLSDIQERTGIDRATISKLERGEIPNPTLGTLRTYASALGKRLSWTLTDNRNISNIDHI